MTNIKKIDWYRTEISRELMKELAVRSNIIGFFFICLHFSLIFCTGYLFLYCFAQHLYYPLPFILMAHGILFSFLGFAGFAHELNHRTVFATPFINDFFLALASLLTWSNFIYFKKSHLLHHRYTVFDDLDGEVKLPQRLVLLNIENLIFFDFPLFSRSVRILFQNACNIIKGDFGNKMFPAGSAERRKLVWWARCVLLFHAILISGFVYFQQWQYIALINLAPFFCTFLNRTLSQAQHYGLNPNVNDYRNNTRTVLLNPFLSFLYWQMNYHTEHHMFPFVPFFKLKRLSKEIAHDLPSPVKGLYTLIRHMRRIHSSGKSAED